MNYHGEMMNIPTRPVDGRWGEARRLAYVQGHKDARHAAAEIANEADALIAELAEALQRMVNHSTSMSHHAIHPSKRFCDVCGLNSELNVHTPSCPVGAAEAAIAKAEGRQS